MNKNLSPLQRVSIERSIDRPHIEDFIEHLFSDFFEQKGDHLFDEDKIIFGGIYYIIILSSVILSNFFLFIKIIC